jgi:N utilization substance protein B
MQSIFAFAQSKDSNYNIGKQNIDAAFTRDLNSMEVQDSKLLSEQSKEAKKLYHDNFLNKGISINSSEIEKINEITTNVISNFHSRVENDIKYFRTKMVSEAEKITEWYILFLQLIVEFSLLAENDTKIKGENFVKNLLTKAIKFNKSIESFILKFNLSWAPHEDQVKSWYKELIRKDETFIAYLGKSTTSFEEDAEIIHHLAKTLFKNDLIASFMEEEDINWVEDKAIVRSMVLKTIKSIEAENPENFELMELSYNWEDDKEFFIKLYNETLNLDEEFKDMIAQRTKNWDIDRLAAVDRITLEMGVAEMIAFPSIPIKVTINEYIELAKNYSTPKSKQFINGILDTISKDLIEQGKIRKSGRGLIDNQ